MTNWESDDITLKNELKLIDDSYYRVYDDNDYEIWKERMLSIIENQTKNKNITTTQEESTTLNSSHETDKIGVIESTINEINPIKPVILELSSETIYKGIEPKPPNIENYNLNVSWGMKYLLGEIDQKCSDPSQQSLFKSILLDSKPGRSKWNNPNRIGQDELYQGLEKVLLDLKSYTPYSIPFLLKVSKKDVPDYYNVIKRPMDLSTMGKKLKSQEYNNKQQFVDDLNLIFSNCFSYNTAEDSIYRQHIQMLRDKWTYLLKSVPDIVVGKADTLLGDKKTQKQPINVATGVALTQEKITAQSQNLNQAKTSKNIIAESDALDDLDDLLNAHLDSLSDAESCPSPKKQRKSTQEIAAHSHVNDLSDKFPRRCDKLMMKYSSDCKAAWGRGKISRNENEIGSSFVFPELVYFFNSVPDAHLIKQNEIKNFKNYSYSSVNTMNRFYDNFRILQSIRTLRRHLLEGSRAEIPSIEYLKSPSNRFDRFGKVFKDLIENSWQAKSVLRKIITLYLAQAGFELISGSALHAFYELVDWNLTKIFETLKLLNEQFGDEKDSAEILRLALLQLNLKHLSDLDVVMVEDSYAKGRLEHLLSVMCSKVQEYQSNIRLSDEVVKSENNNNNGSSSEELDEDDEEVDDENEEADGDEVELRPATEIDENEENDDEEQEDLDEEIDDNEED